MTLGVKQLDALSADDLQSLIDAGITEGRTIEFKQSVGGTDRDKKEFLADVSSFANAAGGDLLVGVTEKAGVAVALTGIPADEADATILRLENLIRDGLDPRIPGLHSRAIPVSADRAVIVIRVPRSFAAPHMVTLGGASRFYSRNSAGKHQLDVGEIRAAFALSDAARTRLQNFRIERLAKITANETPIELSRPCRTVLHVIPLTAADNVTQIDAAAVVADPQHFRPLSGNGWDTRVNFDGALAYAPYRDESRAGSYTQLFRNGAIEGVESVMLRRENGASEHPIPSLLLERTLIGALRLYLTLLGQFGIEGPYLIGLSLLDVRGQTMALSQGRHAYLETHPIDRNDLVVPELLVEDPQQPPATILKPAIDAIWQAAGWRGSENYDAEGVWHDR